MDYIQKIGFYFDLIVKIDIFLMINIIFFKFLIYFFFKF